MVLLFTSADVAFSLTGSAAEDSPPVCSGISSDRLASLAPARSWMIWEKISIPVVFAYLLSDAWASSISLHWRGAKRRGVVLSSDLAILPVSARLSRRRSAPVSAHFIVPRVFMSIGQSSVLSLGGAFRVHIYLSGRAMSAKANKVSLQYFVVNNHLLHVPSPHKKRARHRP